MDAAAFFAERSADVAAFSALLFQNRAAQELQTATHLDTSEGSAARSFKTKSTKKSKESGGKSKLQEPSLSSSLMLSSSLTGAATPAYRRPASANVPVSRVLQEAKARLARRQRAENKNAQRVNSGTAGDGETFDSSTASSAAALGFTAQEIRDRTYVLMSDKTESLSSPEDASRYAARQPAVLTQAQLAQLQRLRIKQRHRHALSYPQWVLLLRRRRRLWQRRRPLARRRHLARSLALQYGRALGPCPCCLPPNTNSGHGRMNCDARRAGTRKEKVQSVKRKVVQSACQVTQWLPSHARLVKRFHHRVLVMAMSPSVVHTPHQKSNGNGEDGIQKSLSQQMRRVVPVARVSVPSEPKRKGHRFLQRWATALGKRQHEHAKALERHFNKGASASFSESSHGPSLLSTSLVADLSYQCVYSIARRRHVAADTSTTLTDVAETLGLRRISTSRKGATGVQGAAFSLPLNKPRLYSKQCSRAAVVAVVHGHLWSAGEDDRAVASTRSASRDGRRRLSTLSRHTRIVPVVLVHVQTRGTKDTTAKRDCFYLFSEAPVLVTRRASKSLQVRLLSAWNPCSTCSAFASVYEVWQWDEPTSLSATALPSSTTDCGCVQRVKSAAQRCARVHQRLRCRRGATGHRTLQQRRKSRRRLKRLARKKNNTNAAIRSKKTIGHRAEVKQEEINSSLPSQAHSVRRRLQRRQQPRLSLLVFPSLPQPFLHSSPVQGESEARPFAWRVCFLLQRPKLQRKRTDTDATQLAKAETAALPLKSTSIEGTSQRVVAQSTRARRLHFQLARRFFGYLVTSPFSPATATGTRSMPCARRNTRVLGLRERATLLRLVGRPAYPLDYGQSRPSLATQRRWDERLCFARKGLVTRESRKRRRQPAEEGGDSFVGFPAPVTSLPSYVHTVEYYGNLTNAATRVTVRSALPDRKLPTLHCTVGCVLLRCSLSPAADSAAVERVGVVSSSPFFAQRFGCMLAAVWCCFPSSGSSAVTPVSPVVEQSNSAAVGQQSVAPRSDEPTIWTSSSLLTFTEKERSAWYVLAPPEAAETVLRLSAALQRPLPQRTRVSGRRQRAFDLARGRSARKLETFLLDPTFCSTVELLRWYA